MKRKKEREFWTNREKKPKQRSLEQNLKKERKKKKYLDTLELLRWHIFLFLGLKSPIYMPLLSQNEKIYIFFNYHVTIRLIGHPSIDSNAPKYYISIYTIYYVHLYKYLVGIIILSTKPLNFHKRVNLDFKSRFLLKTVYVSILIVHFVIWYLKRSTNI